MEKVIRIGTRESQLAVWQANTVKGLLLQYGYAADLVFIKSEGDTDLTSPLYEIGVQGIFTRALDIALLNNEIDIAVHSMKDVPTQMPAGIVQCAVLPRASSKDIFVPKSGTTYKEKHSRSPITIGTSSIRRRAQWLHRYPGDIIENLRGNVNTRLRKVEENNWQGAIFAAAGLDRIHLRPANAVELDWMLPAPAQGAIMVACRDSDNYAATACMAFHHQPTAMCTAIERAFLRALMGGCSTPISALAEIDGAKLTFTGNILSRDGRIKREIKKELPVGEAVGVGEIAAAELLQDGGQQILDSIHNES